MAKKKVLKLDIDEMDEETIEMIGICSHVPNYKLTWSINTNLNLNLVLSDTLFSTSEKVENKFPYFFQEIAEEESAIYLVQNKYAGKTMVSELSQIDYFLFLVDNKSIDVEEMNSALRKLDKLILVSYVMDHQQYNSLKNLIFERNEKN